MPAARAKRTSRPESSDRLRFSGAEARERRSRCLRPSWRSAGVVWGRLDPSPSRDPRPSAVAAISTVGRPVPWWEVDSTSPGSDQESAAVRSLIQLGHRNPMGSVGAAGTPTTRSVAAVVDRTGPGLGRDESVDAQHWERAGPQDSREKEQGERQDSRDQGQGETQDSRGRRAARDGSELW